MVEKREGPFQDTIPIVRKRPRFQRNGGHFRVDFGRIKEATVCNSTSERMSAEEVMKKQASNAGKDHRVRKVDQPEAAKPARIVDVSDDPVLARIGLKAWNHATSRWSREILTWFCETSRRI